MHDYAMFADGDNVLIGVSGGVDSLTLACLLKLWLEKAPINLKLTACYIDHGFWRDADGAADPGELIGDQLRVYSIPYIVLPEREINGQTRDCFLCARNRRNQLFDLAEKLCCSTLAMGHHKDDLIETFMINALYSGNISTMVPKQKLFAGALSIVRPMAYLDKKEVRRLAAGLRLKEVQNFCPIAGDTKREKVREMLRNLYERESGTKASLFKALANVRREYML